jgi:hypothetical protein
VFVLCGTSVSQTTPKFKKVYSVYAGMGIDYGITPDFNDYLVAAIPYSTGDSLKSFNAGVEFFGGLDYELSRTFGVRVDYSYYIRSLSYTYSPAVFDYTIISHQPYLFGNYILRFDHFNFKFGVGIGYHFQQLDNKVNSTTTITYSSGGPSVRAEVVFAPLLSKNFQGYLSGFAFGNFYGTLKDDNGNPLKADNSTVEAALNGYGVGARLGFLINLN